MTTIDVRAEWAGHAKCWTQTQDDVVGYAVVQTIDGRGKVLAEPVVVASYDNPPRPFAWTNAYIDALDHARRLRHRKGWAVVATRYSCGHSLW